MEKRRLERGGAFALSSTRQVLFQAVPRFLQFLPLQVRFSDLSHGWISVELETRDENFEPVIERHSISYIYPSCLAELCDALCAARENRAAVVEFALEPDLLELRLLPDGKNLRVEILVKDNGMSSPSGAARLKWGFTGTTNEIVTAFWFGLLDLRNKYSPEEFKREWRYDFPDAHLRCLAQSLAQTHRLPF